VDEHVVDPTGLGVDMAFQLVQTFNFDDVQYSYDRTGDVLYISASPIESVGALEARGL
jgi:hypothetical protein